MYNIFSGILQAVGNSRRPLYYLIVSSILNILLDLLFIGVFKWGVGSASTATAISQLISAVLCFLFLIKKGTVYQVKISKIKFHGDMLKQIFKYGITALVGFFCCVMVVLWLTNCNPAWRLWVAIRGEKYFFEKLTFFSFYSF